MKDMNVSELEEYLAGVRITPSAELDESVRRMAEETEQAEAGRVRRSSPRLLRVAACLAGVCAVAFVVWLAFGNRFSIMPSAYAQVEEALANSKAAEWIHAEGTTSGDKVEAWLSLRPFRSFKKSGDGRLEVVDISAARMYEYSPATHRIIISQITEKPPAGLKLNSSLLDIIESQLKTLQAEGAIHVTRETRVIDGKAYTVLKIKADEVKNGWGSGEIVVDPAQRRIVQFEVLDPKDGKSAGRVYFDYPAAGPEDIYALGAPRDAKVVNAPPPPAAPAASPEAEKLQALVVAARDHFAPTYCATTLEGTVLHNGSLQPQEVDVIYKKNGHWRLERYVPSDARGYALPPGFFRPDDMNSVLAWAKGQRPWQVAILSSLEEDYEHRNCGVVFSIGNNGALEKGSPGNIVHWIPEYHSWHEIAKLGGAYALLPSRQSDFGQLTVLEHTVQAYLNGKGWIGVPQRDQWSVNPSRDFIVEEYEFESNPENAPWQVDKDWRKGLKLTPQQENRFSERLKVAEYAQTAQGQWYARKVIRNQTEMYIIHVATTQEIPDELFDPSKVDAACLHDPFVKHPR